MGIISRSSHLSDRGRYLPDVAPFLGYAQPDGGSAYRPTIMPPVIP